MNITQFDIQGLYLFEPRKFGDDRGFFMETFRQSHFEGLGLDDLSFPQHNHSVSTHKYTVRGLHFQTPPHAQGKLVRCSKGRVYDVAVDARIGSPTYGQHVRVELSAENCHQLFVPAGFLHGFATLEHDCEVQYLCTDYYAGDCDGNIAFDDPDLAIDWGIPNNKAVLSEKDSHAPAFADFKSPFKYTAS